MEEIVGGVIKFVGRIVVQFLVEVVFEVLLKGPGYLIVKSFDRLISIR